MKHKTNESVEIYKDPQSTKVVIKDGAKHICTLKYSYMKKRWQYEDLQR